MRRHPLLLLVLALLPGLVFAADLSPSTVMAHTAQYDGQAITVTGTVSHFKPTVSRRGNAYETFKLCDKDTCLAVFAWGNAPRTESARITVSGHFFTVKRVGRYTYYNELDLD